MPTITAKVLAHSRSEFSKAGELITFEIWCHRWILAEINTHRKLARNYRSSRAVPTAKLLEEVRTDPAMPIMWGKNRPGMQSTEVMSASEAKICEKAWRDSALDAAWRAEILMGAGLHKQWANRIIEPFLFVAGVISGTDWENFWALRRHADAQPEFRALADAMWEAKQASWPADLQQGDWHLPYVDQVNDTKALYDAWEADAAGMSSRIEFDSFVLPGLRKLSAARCARVSIAPFDGEASIEKEFARFDRLMGSAPMHSSPTEHQATPDREIAVLDRQGRYATEWRQPEQSGNFRPGWIQFRKTIAGEAVPG